MEKVHSYYSKKQNITINFIEFKNRHLYLKIQNLNELLNDSFEDWKAKNYQTEILKSSYYDWFNYESLEDYQKELVIEYNDEKLCSFMLAYSFILKHNIELAYELDAFNNTIVFHDKSLSCS